MLFPMKFTSILVWLCSLSCVLKSQEVSIQAVSCLVTAAPYMEIVQKIGGEAVEVRVIVPQGVDFHNFEPTIQQITELEQAKIWFCMGEPFEMKIQKFLKDQNSQMQFVDLRDNLPLIQEKDPQHVGGSDPHIWMSPRLMMIQAKTIATALIRILPEKKAKIENNLTALIDSLEELDHKIAAIIEKKHTHFLVTQHPAYGYFCREFHIEQIAIEQQGKEPPPRVLIDLIERLKTLQIKTIFITNPTSAKGAAVVAEAIHAHLAVHNPYITDYFQMMTSLAEELP
jgi:zinc transport system substrate-binding protein